MRLDLLAKYCLARSVTRSQQHVTIIANALDFARCIHCRYVQSALVLTKPDSGRYCYTTLTKCSKAYKLIFTQIAKRIICLALGICTLISHGTSFLSKV